MSFNFSLSLSLSLYPMKFETLIDQGYQTMPLKGHIPPTTIVMEFMNWGYPYLDWGQVASYHGTISLLSLLFI